MLWAENERLWCISSVKNCKNLHSGHVTESYRYGSHGNCGKGPFDCWIPHHKIHMSHFVVWFLAENMIFQVSSTSMLFFFAFVRFSFIVWLSGYIFTSNLSPSLFLPPLRSFSPFSFGLSLQSPVSDFRKKGILSTDLFSQSFPPRAFSCHPIWIPTCLLQNRASTTFPRLACSQVGKQKHRRMRVHTERKRKWLQHKVSQQCYEEKKNISKHSERFKKLLRCSPSITFSYKFHVAWLHVLMN